MQNLHELTTVERDTSLLVTCDFEMSMVNWTYEIQKKSIKSIGGEPDGWTTEKYEEPTVMVVYAAPLTEEDRAFFAYFRSVFKRYNINPSKATRLEYDFVTRVAESEFYLENGDTRLTHANIFC